MTIARTATSQTANTAWPEVTKVTADEMTVHYTLEWVLTPAQPPASLPAHRTSSRRGRDPVVRSQTYEITFSGQAGATLRAAFDDCEISTGPGTTTLRAELPDQGALTGLVQRITGLGLKVLDLHLLTPPGR